MQWLGSLVFTTVLFLSVAVYGCVVLILRLFGYRAMYAGVRLWVRFILTMLRWLCGLDYAVRGSERLPPQNGIILMKHSSAWETIAQFVLFPHQTWVLKRELIWAPILGWIIYFLKPIAINRQGGRAAVEQVTAQGKARIEEGLWVIIFPEGTRVPAGERKRYGVSGALLARAAGQPVIPVAHNAGVFWPRRSMLKKSGTIQVVIGEPIETAGREPREINNEVQDWIEAELRAMETADI